MYRENNKGRKSGTKNCIFLKRMSFRATQVEKVESLGKMRGGGSAGAGAGRGGAAFARHILDAAVSIGPSLCSMTDGHYLIHIKLR